MLIIGKHCTKCKIYLSLEKFYRASHHSDQKTSQCKQCLLKKHSQYQKQNRAASSASNRRHYKRNPKSHQAYGLKKRFGLSLEQYDQMLKDQDLKCAICNKHQEILTRRMAVDHCHKTGRLRALLCNSCNRGIGLFADDANLVEKAASYLKTYDALFRAGKTDDRS
jgi:hypothetical protein